MVVLDHVVWAVADLSAAALALTERTGLATLPGGTHAGWGTSNEIVPIGGSYLELVAVAQSDVAALCSFGRLVARGTARGGGPCGYCVAVDDIDAVAAAQRLEVEEGRRTRADGSVLRWRIAGAAQAEKDPTLPFLIAWCDPAERPGGLRAPHRVNVGRLRLLTPANAEQIVRRTGGPVGGVIPDAADLDVQLDIDGVEFRLDREFRLYAS